MQLSPAFAEAISTISKAESVSNVFEYPFLALIDDVFDLPDRQVELFRQRLITDSVQQPALQYAPVTLAENPFVNQMFNF